MYAGGILDATDEATYCSSNLNHAVVIVGYTPGTTSVSEAQNIRRCRKRDRLENLFNVCDFADEELRYARWCCRDASETYSHSYDTGAYWTIQESQGTGWGESGYARIEV